MLLVRVLFALAVTGAIAIAGCAASSNSTAKPAAEANYQLMLIGEGSPRRQQLPPFPQIEEYADKSASVNINLFLNGSDHYDTNVTDGDSNLLHLVPDQGDTGSLAWAIYKLPGLSHDANVTSLSVSLTDMDVLAEYYFSLADYESLSWQHFSRVAVKTSDSFSLVEELDPARHISPGNALYLAVLAFEDQATVQSVTLTASTSLAPPQNLECTDGTSGSEVIMSWDVVPGAENYEIFYKEAAQSDEYYSFLDEIAADPGSPGYSHTGSNPPGKPSIYGVEYMYKVRATAGGEDPSPFSLPDSGMRRLPAPYYFTATDRLDDQVVRLGWRCPPPTLLGPRTFRVFRDDVSAVPPSYVQVGDAFFVNDDPGDLEEHEYYVVEIGPDGDSPPSMVDTGCVGQWNGRIIVASNTHDDSLKSEAFRSDMNQAAHDPGAAAICFMDENTEWINYCYSTIYNPQGYCNVDSVVPPGPMAVLGHLGRPWVAYGMNTFVPGASGFYIARSEVSQPATENDWEIVQLNSDNASEAEIAMGEIGGKLAVVAVEWSGMPFGADVHYYYALTADPRTKADWQQGTVTYIDNSNFDEAGIDLIEFNGRPLIAVQDDTGLTLYESNTDEPRGIPHWNSYPVPLASADMADPAGVDLVLEGGQLYISTLISRRYLFDDSRLVISHPTSWPPTEEDWLERTVFAESGFECSGVSMMFMEGRPIIAWSQDDVGHPWITYPVIVDGDFTWNLNQWVKTSPDLGPSPPYDESVYEVNLRNVNGQLALLHTCREVNVGSPRYKDDLIYSRIKGKGE